MTRGEVSHPCDCCGHLTLEAPGPRSDQLCPVCCWEHTDPSEDAWNGSNRVDLAEAQRNYLAFGAAEEDYIDVVRPPRADEPLDPEFLPWEQARRRDGQQVYEHLERAFAGVELEGGTNGEGASPAPHRAGWP